MNPRLDKLHPYPFEQLSALLAGVNPPDGLPLIALSLGEPKHRAPDFIIEQYRDPETIARGCGTYPPTRGAGPLPILSPIGTTWQHPLTRKPRYYR
jgi:N-succinyldiaminopimelate aminotransferase